MSEHQVGNPRAVEQSGNSSRASALQKLDAGGNFGPTPSLVDDDQCGCARTDDGECGCLRVERTAVQKLPHNNGRRR